jgi:anti-sigma regulatory factor (Ser/Thr protein kinase)
VGPVTGPNDPQPDSRPAPAPAPAPAQPADSERAGAQRPAERGREDVVWHRIDDPSAVGRARRAAIALAARAGLTDSRAADVGLAVTEAATNLIRHAEDGALLLRLIRSGDQAGVELAAVDSGPGIADLALATEDGHSSRGSLGIGLGAITRLASGVDLHSVPGRGTVLTAAFWPPHVPDRRPSVDGVTRPISGEEVSGDAWAVRTAGGRQLALLCDGLGHGRLAARAATEAVRAFLTDAGESPEALLRRLHVALGGSRGAAAAVALLDYPAGQLTYAGVGNIAGWLVSPGRRSGLLTYPGIVGHQTRTIRAVGYPLPRDAVLIMHSDGVNDRWNLADYPGLVSHRPLTIAATLLRDAGVRRDDASVLVGKPPPASGGG